jgi:hypothetical protein
MDVVEKRSFVRVPFSAEVILKSPGTRITGRIENLSLGGAFINTPKKIEQGTDVEVEIFLDDPPTDLSVILGAKVVRLAPEGIAIQFTGMTMEVFERLRDVIGDIHGDRRKVVAEFLKYLDLNPFFTL